MDMIDQDQTDQKILAVPNRNPRYDEIHTMDQIFIHVRREIEHFFTIYGVGGAHDDHVGLEGSGGSS